MSQSKVFNADKGTTTRVKHTTGAQTGAGDCKRLYIGTHGGYDYAGYLRFSLNWTDVGKITSAILTLTADDGYGYYGALFGDEPKFRVRRLTSAFSEHTGSETFDADDWTNPTSTATDRVIKSTPKDYGAMVNIDITAIVRAWAPSSVAGGGKAPNYGIALLGTGEAKNMWSCISEDESESKPYITLYYEYGPTIPSTPTNLSPSGAVSAIASFAGDFADARAIDLLAYSQVQVYDAGHSCSGIGTNDVVTSAAHGLANGAVVYFTSLTGGAGLSTFTKYYVRDRTTNTFKVATTPTGAAVNVTDAYSAATWSKIIYDLTQAESNAAILAARFDHVPSDLSIDRNTNYRWRCRVKDSTGDWSLWTGLTTFSITNTNPDAPTLTPAGASEYVSLDGVQFSGTFSDEDDGDYLLAYQVQLGKTAEGTGWLDDTNILWNTGKRYVASEATEFSTPYGGAELNAGTYYWRARVWDNHQGVSNWAYASIVLTSDFEPEPLDSVNAIQLRPRAPWRIVIKEMAMNAVGGGITGTATTNLITTTTNHGLVADQRVRFSALTGGAGLFTGVNYYILASGLAAKTFKVSTSVGGNAVDFTTDITSGTVTAVTTRGPGNTVAVLEDAKNVGASLLYNSPGEAHWTLSATHPQLGVIEPKQTHYSIQLRQGDGWREVFAGLVWDFDATPTDIIFYGLDYLALLDLVQDERYKPGNINASYTKGGSKYSDVAISTIIADQLAQARKPKNSPVGFISTGNIATLSTPITIYSTYQPTLSFIVGLIDSARAGTARFTRLAVRQKTGGGYEFVVLYDPGTVRNNLRLRYGELVQGYRIIPFGSQWASRVNAIGRDKDGVLVRYVSKVAARINEATWGRFALSRFIDGVSDSNDLARRTQQAVQEAAAFGKQIGLGLRSGVLQPRDGYDLLDLFPVDIEHGAVHTSAFGHDGLWVAVGITWQALERGDLNTTLTLRPKLGGSSASDDLLTSVPMSTQKEWQIGWTDPNPLILAARYWLNQTTGKVFARQDGTLISDEITGTA